MSIKNLFNVGLSLVLMSFMASCSEFEEQSTPVNSNSLKSIPEVLRSIGAEDGEDFNA